jgi:hypothetical protein
MVTNMVTVINAAVSAIKTFSQRIMLKGGNWLHFYNR